MVHSVSGSTRGVQVKLRSLKNACHLLPEPPRGVFTIKRYTNPPLPLPYLTLWLSCSLTIYLMYLYDAFDHFFRVYVYIDRFASYDY